MENVWLASAVWLGLALLASIISIRIAMSIALVEIVVGAVAGNVIGLHLTEWVNFLAGFGAILLTFLAGTECARGGWFTRDVKSSSDAVTIRLWQPAQPVDATQALNLSAGVGPRAATRLGEDEVRRAVLDCVFVRALSICPQSRRTCIGGLRNVDARVVSVFRVKAKPGNCSVFQVCHTPRAIVIQHIF
jgi:hypothetical protein